MVNAIDDMGISDEFDVQKHIIRNKATGSEFIFKGLHHHIEEIKSLHGVDVVWIEEARSLTKRSIQVLPPTFRKSGSEIWVSFNPLYGDDPIYELTKVYEEKGHPMGAIVKHLSWRDNPFFGAELEAERQASLRDDEPEMYDHIWEGDVLRSSSAVVYRGKLEQGEFSARPSDRLLFGADWGFAKDPTVLVRAFERDKDLYVEYAVYGYGVDLSDTPSLFLQVPGASLWPINADSARPETISYMSGKPHEGKTREGVKFKDIKFKVYPAKKWNGSIEDGITFIRKYRKIYVHTRCVEFWAQITRYSYKTDKYDSSKVLPVLQDGFDDGPDALRYALDGKIRGRRRMPHFTDDDLRRL